MFADLDRTLRELLIRELPIKNHEIEIAFDQPKREWSGKLSKPTINLFLYDVRENPHLRVHQWEQMMNGPNGGAGGDGAVRQKRTPLRVDCFYMLTAWASDPSDEHRLLYRAMRAFRNPIIGDQWLEGQLRNPRFELRTRLASHDILTNPAEVWGALENDLRPSISYLVTLAIDPWEEVEGPAVRTFTFSFGPEGAPAELRTRTLAPDVQRATLNVIGGTVYSADDGRPVADVEVVIQGTGLYTRTDKTGRYRFSGLLPDQYTLSVQTPAGKPVTKPISVPAARGEDYDLEV